MGGEGSCSRDETGLFDNRLLSLIGAHIIVYSWTKDDAFELSPFHERGSTLTYNSNKGQKDL